MKKSILGLCTALIVVAMTSCGGGQNSQSQSNSIGSVTTNPSTSTSTSTSVVEKVLTGIEVGTYPKTQYMVGDDFEITGGMLDLIYQGAANESIPMTLEMVQNVPDMSTPGSKTVNLSYLGFTTSYNIQVSVVKTDPTFTWSFENNATFQYDGTGEAPDISVTVNEQGVLFETYFSKDDINLGTSIPTENGTYSLVIETEANEYYNAARMWRNFKINNKEVPTVNFNFEPSQIFEYDGTGEAPDISFTVSDGVEYDWHYEKDEVDIGKTVPTTPGYYALVVETQENSTYSAETIWRVFQIKAPTAKILPTINFNFEAGQIFVYDGTGEAPDISVTVNDGVIYDWHYEKDEVDIGKTVPTTQGYYALIVETQENATYQSVRQWRVFQIQAPTTKLEPTITFSFEPSEIFVYDGTGEAPDISVTVSDGVIYDWHYEKDEVDIGKTVPTTPGYYALIVENQENATYQSVRQWRVFQIQAPTTKLEPTITFSFEPSEIFVYDGTGEAPDISVTVSDGVIYEWHFEQDEKNIGQTIPTTPGHYSLVVDTEENASYVAKRIWRVFEIQAPTSEISLKKALPR